MSIHARRGEVGVSERLGRCKDWRNRQREGAEGKVGSRERGISVVEGEAMAGAGAGAGV